MTRVVGVAQAYSVLGPEIGFYAVSWLHRSVRGRRVVVHAASPAVRAARAVCLVERCLPLWHWFSCVHNEV